MIISQHPSKHSVGREPQNNYNVPNDNRIDEVRQTLLRRVTSWILLQRSGHPLTPIRFCHGYLPSNSIPEEIMIIGRWSNNALLQYIRIQVIDINKCISDLMLPTGALYTTLEAEVIYYNMGQPRVQYHMLNPKRGITNSTTSPLSLPL